MKKYALGIAAISLAACVANAATSDEYFDKLDDFLTVNLLQGKVRARLSGTIDLEAYSLPQPAPGLIYTERYSLFNPRLTLFFDAQIGPHVYVFVQGRADQGFDPGYLPYRVAADEYAIRYTPWEDGRLSVQAGKFATVFGTWSQRHASWDSPFITAPLPYENLTGVWDDSAAIRSKTLRYWSGLIGAAETSRRDALDARKERLPVIWGSSYTSGAAIFGHLGKFEYAAEVKNASLSSRPSDWDATAVQWRRPAFSARLGYRPNQSWNIGASGSIGTYLNKGSSGTTAAGHSLSDYRQIVLGQDISFAWHHWELWAEVFESRFEVPGVGNADSLAYYLEAKYKFTPQLFGAVRWNQHVFGTLPNSAGGEDKWVGDIWRTDIAFGYRFTAHTQLKLQYSLERRSADIAGFGNTFAAQFTIRF
ncbi:MAG: hypothetical protein WCO67_25250 [Betaproteobacteria bacterium]